jgi:HK97 family phage prohead protease
VNRAYSLLTVKSVDEGSRRIKGTATTPSPDRMGDVIEPLGARFPAEIPLLLHHKKELPVGRAFFKKPTKNGIDFEAEIPVIDTPGIVRDRVNEAWDSVKAGLIRGVSIGFRAINDAIEPLKTGGLRFLETEILELSLVTVPANADATLAVLKSIDSQDLAASGLNTPGVTGTLPLVRAQKGAHPMTTAEQISAFEAKRAANTARMTAIMSGTEGSTLAKGTPEEEEYTTLDREVDEIDLHLPRLRKLEKQLQMTATPITPTTSQVTASELRGGTATTPVITVKPNVPKGTSFTRAVMALAAGKGDSYQTLEYAKKWHDSTPEVEQIIQHMWRTKAAVAERIPRAASAAHADRPHSWLPPGAVQRQRSHADDWRNLRMGRPGLAQAGDEGRLLDYHGAICEGLRDHRDLGRTRDVIVSVR